MDNMAFYRGSTIIKKFSGDFTAARREGDRLGNKYGRVALHFYNKGFGRWEHLCDFLGRHIMVALNERRLISEDYRNTTPVK